MRMKKNLTSRLIVVYPPLRDPGICTSTPETRIGVVFSPMWMHPHEVANGFDDHDILVRSGFTAVSHC